MRIQAYRSLLLPLSFVNVGDCLPGFQVLPARHLALRPGAFSLGHPHIAEPAITPGPELSKALLGRRAAQVVTISCDGSTSCVAYDVSYSSITAFNPQQLTATDENWCFGPGCVSVSSFPSVSGTGDGAQNVSSTTSTQSAPFINSTDTTTSSLEAGPTAISSTSSSEATPTNNSTDILQTATPGPTAIGTGNSSSSTSAESAFFNNGTGTAPIAPETTLAGTAAGTGSPSGTVPSEAGPFSNTTDVSGSPGPTGFGTGTGVLTTQPGTIAGPSSAPFANGTEAARPEPGPTGTGLAGTGVRPEEPTVTLITSGTTVSITTFPEASWSAWSGSNTESIEASITTCSDEVNSPEQTSQSADAAETSFKSTATLSFADTTYVIPVPASFTSDIPGPDSNEDSVSSFADAVGQTETSTEPSPTPAVYATGEEASSYSIGYDAPRATSDTTFSPVTWVTSSCYTTTFFDVITTSTGPVHLVPTGSTGICYGISCNEQSSCQDWMSVVPFSVAAGNTTSSADRAPYANATTTSQQVGAVTGTVTRGGGFYPAETGTNDAASSQITDNPWPSSPNATRNSAAYTNTAEITPVASSAAAIPVETSIDPVSVSTLFSTFTNENGSITTSAYSTVTFDAVVQKQSLATDSAFIESHSADDAAQTHNVAATLHPWAAWTATLETSTTSKAVTNDAASASPTSGVYDDTDDEDEDDDDDDDDGPSLSVPALASKFKRSALKAKRVARGRPKHNQVRQEKKYDTLLQKKRVEWEAGRGDRSSNENYCCTGGFSVYCWFVKSKVDSAC